MEVTFPYLDLTILSAEDLKRNWLSGDQIVAVAWVDSLTKKKTGAASVNGSNVEWPHENLTLKLNSGDITRSKLLTIEIHARGILTNSVLGSVYVPLVELPLNGDKEGSSILMYQIIQPSGKPQGSMKFFAKVVWPRAGGSPVSVRGSAAVSLHTPSRVSSHDDQASNAFYPPPDAMCRVDAWDRPSSSAPHPSCPPMPEGYPYPPAPQHFFQDFPATHDGWQPEHTHGASHSPYPPQNTTYPPSTPPAVYPPQYPPLSAQFSETSYMPPPPVYPPRKESSYAPVPLYPPYPPPAPQFPPDGFQPASFYPHSDFSNTVYPPPYPPQETGVHYPHHPMYCSTNY